MSSRDGRPQRPGHSRGASAGRFHPPSPLGPCCRLKPAVRPRCAEFLDPDLSCFLRGPGTNLSGMTPHRLLLSFVPSAVLGTLPTLAESVQLPGVGAGMQEMVARNEIAGAVTAVVT